MKYLVLEGSATAASCALLENQKVLGEFFVNIPQTHSQTLLPMVEGLLSTCGVNPGPGAWVLHRPAHRHGGGEGDGDGGG